MADWNALMNAPNAGQAFTQSFQQAQQMRQQQAMQAHQMKRQEVEDQRRAAADQQGQIEQYRDGIVKAGQIIRSIKAKNPQMPDDQVYMTAHQMAVQMRIPGAEHAPPNFDPQYYQQLVAAADAFDPPKPNEAPNSVQEFEYAKQKGFQGGYTDFLQFVHPPSAVTIPHGATVQAPGQAGGDMPTVSTPQDAMKLPPGSQFRLPDGRIGTVPGGAGGNASGGFQTGPQ